MAERVGVLPFRLVLLIVAFLICSTCVSFSANPLSIRRNNGNIALRESRVVETEQPRETSSPEDDFFRSFRQKVPLKIQSFLRDSGLLRFIVDTLTWTSAVPAVVDEHPEAVARFLQLSGLPSPVVEVVSSIWKSDRAMDPQIPGLSEKVRYQKIKYGEHPNQFIDFMRLEKRRETTNSTKTVSTCRNLLLFVHGGAWGSGSPSIYRLVAAPFLKCNVDVAILGYRTYPDANAQEQVDDVVASIRKLRDDVIDSNTKVTLMGHSSGSHIASMALLSNDYIRETVDFFVALSGVFDIPKHYQFERTRGVERISPLAPACAAQSMKSPILVLNAWKRLSPTSVLQTKESFTKFPSTLVLHGQLDTTVPVDSAMSFATSLQRCIGSQCVDIDILENVGHVDVVMHLMFGGGPSRDAVLKWMVTKGAISIQKREVVTCEALQER